MLLQYLKLLRIHQWIKNVIIFAGIIFAKKLTDPESVQRVISAFFFFHLLLVVSMFSMIIWIVRKMRYIPKKNIDR